MRLLNRLIFTTVVLIASALSLQAQTTGEKPNIVFILIDDLGWMDLGYQGSEVYKTPEIDELASESVNFKQAYMVYPRCVPSRYGLMTGIYPARNKVPASNHDLLPEDKTFAHRLSENGYTTAYIGKWHLGSGKLGPGQKGFDVSTAAGEAGAPINYFYPYNDISDKPWKKGKAPIPDVQQGSEGEYLNDRLTDEALKFMEDNKSEPFMLMMAHYAVHTPLEAPDSLKRKYRKIIRKHDYGKLPKFEAEGTGVTKMRQDNPTYAAMIDNMDWNVGRLLEKLDELGIANNTIVIFTSDHGGLSNKGWKNRNLATSNYPLRAGKGWLYEGGIRVPLLVKWPGVTDEGVNDDAIITGVDFYPTILEMALGESTSPQTDTDGQSFVRVLKGEEQGDRGPIFWHSPKGRPHSTGDTNSSAVRLGDYKLIHWYEEDRVELFNIEEDIRELHDLSKTKPEKTEELMTILENWKKEWN